MPHVIWDILFGFLLVPCCNWSDHAHRVYWLLSLLGIFGWLGCLSILFTVLLLGLLFLLPYLFRIYNYCMVIKLLIFSKIVVLNGWLFSMTLLVDHKIVIPFLFHEFDFLLTWLVLWSTIRNNKFLDFLVCRKFKWCLVSIAILIVG